MNEEFWVQICIYQIVDVEKDLVSDEIWRIRKQRLIMKYWDKFQDSEAQYQDFQWCPRASKTIELEKYFRSQKNLNFQIIYQLKKIILETDITKLLKFWNISRI